MLSLITAPTTAPVTLEEAKEHLRVDFDDNNNKIEALVGAASEYVSDRISLLLAPAVYRIDRCDWWSGCLDILIAPVRDITSVKYLDEANDLQTVDSANYRWSRTKGGARLEFLSSYSLPTVIADTKNAIQVEVAAGYDNPVATGTGDDPELVLPERAKQAILLITGHWYENRESVAFGQVMNVPFAAETLMAQLRIYR